MNSLLFLKDLQINKAVVFSLSVQVWAIALGPLTVIFLGWYLSPDEQGYYYTFTSFNALQLFAEMVLSLVLVQVSSHEWAAFPGGNDASLGRKLEKGSLSRLGSLLRFAIKWVYAWGFTFTLAMGLGGALVLGWSPQTGVIWGLPWLLFCLSCGVSHLIAPFLSILEGCNEVKSIYFIRFLQSAIFAVFILIGLRFGFGLFSLALAQISKFLIGIFGLVFSHRKKLSDFIRSRCDEEIAWWREVLPLQWRSALSWISGYFIFSIFTPIMFIFHGPVQAGQMGMSLTIISALDGIANSWMQPRMPELGVLIARRNFQKLDRLFFKILRISLWVIFFLMASLLGAFGILRLYGFSFSERLLASVPFVCLVLQRGVGAVIGCFSSYLRAHKKEPLVAQSLIGAVLILAFSLLSVREYGAIGLSAGFLLVTVLFSLPATILKFFHFRKEWHRD